MIRRIRRHTRLPKQTQQQAENLLSATLPNHLQSVLDHLNTHLQDAQRLIDGQLRRTMDVTRQAQTDLQTSTAAGTNLPATPASAASLPAAGEAAPADDSAATDAVNAQKAAELNGAIEAKFAAMAQEIARRTQQVGEIVEQRQAAPTVAVPSALSGDD